MFTGLFFGISLALTAISTAIGMATSISAANKQAELQQQQARMQAENLRQQAEQEEQNQIQRSIVERRQNMRKLASAEASYAASGVSLMGTPTLSLGQMAEEQELEVQMQEAASGYKRSLLLTEADNTLAFGSASASLTKQSGILNAVGTGLGGLGNLGFKVNEGIRNGDI